MLIWGFWRDWGRGGWSRVDDDDRRVSTYIEWIKGIYGYSLVVHLTSGI